MRKKVEAAVITDETRTLFATKAEAFKCVMSLKNLLLALASERFPEKTSIERKYLLYEEFL